MATSAGVKARPVLKWAGGKTNLLPVLMARAPRRFRRYIEPFVGGGALFFELASMRSGLEAYLSDINPGLINVYQVVRDSPADLIVLLREHERQHNEEYYYRVREQRPSRLSSVEQAARFIYLNKTCYNGLYRENRAGEFNVPYGRYKNPRICDEANISAASAVLQSAEIRCHSFDEIIDVAQPSDFVYFDPPYVPASATASFTSYYRCGFGRAEQDRLRNLFRALAEKHVFVLLSNSDTRLARELYGSNGWHVDTVYAPRYINSKPSARGRVPEVLVANYDTRSSAHPRLFEKMVSKPRRKRRPPSSRSPRRRAA